MQTIANLEGGSSFDQKKESAQNTERAWQNIYSFGFSQLLVGLSVANVLTPRTVLTVEGDENVSSLLERLRENQLRCACVYDTEKQCVGFVDTFDVVSHVLNIAGWDANLAHDTFQTLAWKAEKFANAPSGSLLNISDRFETIQPNAILRKAVEALAKGVQRIAVVENGSVVNVVSQWDILMLVLSRLSFLGTPLERSLEEAKLVGKDFNLLYSLPETTSTIEAVKYLHNNAISGVPLVDSFGRITMNFSTTNLLNLTPVNFPWLALPVTEFLYKIYGFIKPPIVCRRTDTVESVLVKFACFCIHRVYVVDDAFHPVAVITLTDILQYFMRVSKLIIGSQTSL